MVLRTGEKLYLGINYSHRPSFSEYPFLSMHLFYFPSVLSKQSSFIFCNLSCIGRSQIYTVNIQQSTFLVDISWLLAKLWSVTGPGSGVTSTIIWGCFWTNTSQEQNFWTDGSFIWKGKLNIAGTIMNKANMFYPICHRF